MFELLLFWFKVKKGESCFGFMFGVSRCFYTFVVLEDVFVLEVLYVFVGFRFRVFGVCRMEEFWGFWNLGIGNGFFLVVGVGVWGVCSTDRFFD